MLLFRRYWIAKLLKFVQLGTWSTLKRWNSLRALFTAAKSLAFTAPCRTIKHSPHLWTGRLPFLQLRFNESLRQNWYLTSPSTSSIEREKQKATTTLIFWTEKQNIRAHCTNPPSAQNPPLSLLLCYNIIQFSPSSPNKTPSEADNNPCFSPKPPAKLCPSRLCVLGCHFFWTQSTGLSILLGVFANASCIGSLRTPKMSSCPVHRGVGFCLQSGTATTSLSPEQTCGCPIDVSCASSSSRTMLVLTVRRQDLPKIQQNNIVLRLHQDNQCSTLLS